MNEQNKIFIDAGFEFRQPGCSACLAMNEDKTLTQGKKLTIWEQLFSSYGNLKDRGGARPTQ